MQNLASRNKRSNNYKESLTYDRLDLLLIRCAIQLIDWRFWNFQLPFHFKCIQIRWRKKDLSNFSHVTNPQTQDQRPSVFPPSTYVVQHLFLRSCLQYGLKLWRKKIILASLLFLHLLNKIIIMLKRTSGLKIFCKSGNE